jgi:2-methylcitrate dehydratase PrpD
MIHRVMQADPRERPAAPDDALTASERIAKYVASTRFRDLPTSVVERTRELLIYHLALAFAGRRTTLGKHAIAIARELSGGLGTSTIAGTSARATLVDAVFAHSELIGALGATDAEAAQDDFHLPSKLNLGRATHGVAWVLGEHEHVSGRELITAVVVGYDAGCKLAESVAMGGDYSRMPHKFAFAPFGAAAIAARLLRQDAGRAAHTIAHAAHFSMGVNHGALSAAATSMAARNGVMAALLLPFDRVDDLRAIEAPHGMYAALFGGTPPALDDRLATLGRQYAIDDVRVKYLPMSASHYPPLEQAEALLKKMALRARDVRELVAVVPSELRGRFEFLETWIDGASVTRTEVIRSLRAKLAVLLVTGAIVPQPSVGQFRDPEVQAALAKVSLRYEPIPLDSARVRVVTVDGRSHTAEGGFGLGPKIDATFLRQHGERFLSAARLAELERLVTHLDEVNDVAAVLTCTIPDRHEDDTTTATRSGRSSTTLPATGLSSPAARG